MTTVIRREIRVEGIVQGVGFRPFVYRIASDRKLVGSVLNDSRGVLIEVEGAVERVEAFCHALEKELPPLAQVSRFISRTLPTKGGDDFVIKSSNAGQTRTVDIPPDSNVCDDCLRELFDPADRRYRYPFINCTNCGPRFTIVTDIPYDRPATTMADYVMCQACLEEYRDPLSRRFHAQPNACPSCGPHLDLLDGAGVRVESCDPLRESVERLRQGQVLAIKGLGGYHLAVDATNDAAVERLRRKKLRDEKPFALMVADMAAAGRFVRMTELEQRLLASVERPIVLLEKRTDAPLAPLVAPGNRYYGLMLPYTPLHHLLLTEFAALVMTSGNLTDEPIAYADEDAINRLGPIADAFLIHDRRIHMRTDDSIVRSLGGEPVMLRRSRGYVPRRVQLPRSLNSILALGAELKNTICLSRGDQAYLSQHIGDLKNQEVVDAMRQTIDHLQCLLQVNPLQVAHDQHPDYHSTRVARLLSSGHETVAVQHHHAHLASCMVDNGIDEETIGVIFDGYGYGNDGHAWGGEFLLGDYQDFRRLGHLDYLPMPGGDAVIREPWRMAYSYLLRFYGDSLPLGMIPTDLTSQQDALLRQMVARGINSPLTSSCGRLFDAVSALAGLCATASYEGQPALALEMALEGGAESETGYPCRVHEEEGLLLIDPEPMIRGVVSDLQQGIAASRVSARFHNGLTEMIVQVCCEIRRLVGDRPVALTGGVFQNRYLTETTLSRLSHEDFRVLVHRQVPPNDGGLSLGQLAVAGARS